MRKYKEFRRLVDGHARGIAAVSFSPQGNFVATGGLDGKVCVWRLADGKQIHAFNGQTSILCLEWMPRREDAVLFGSQDGNITIFTITPFAVTVNGFWGHKYPIEQLAMSEDRVATGAHREVTVWQWNNHSRRFYRVHDIPEPPSSSQNQHLEVLVTSLHWTPASETNSSLLMVSYMYHGIHMFETSSWGRVRTIPLSCEIASASLSPDGLYFAVSNLRKGFDVYETATEVLCHSFEHDVGEPNPTPVLFIHDSCAIVGGSTVGKVGIWDVGHGMGKIHSLQIPRRSKVLALAAHYRSGDDVDDEVSYEFYLATAVMNENTTSYCIIWKTENLGNRQPIADENRRKQPPSEGSEDDITSSSQLLFKLLWLAICACFLAYFVMMLAKE